MTDPWRRLDLDRLVALSAMVRDGGVWLAMFRVRLRCECGLSDPLDAVAATYPALCAEVAGVAATVRAAECVNQPQEWRG